MRITKKMLLFVLSLALVAGSLVVFGDSVRLIAEERIGELSGILMMNGALLAAVIFAYRLREVDDGASLSITQPYWNR